MTSREIKDFQDSLVEVVGRMLGTRRQVEKELTIGYEEFIGNALRALHAAGVEIPGVRHHQGVFVINLKGGKQAVVDTNSSLGALIIYAQQWAHLREV